MILNITNDGQILYGGQPFGWAAFIPRMTYTAKPRKVTAQRILYDFTFQQADGSIVPFPKGSWLVKDAAGEFSAMTDADFAEQYDLATAETA